ncbi:MAG: Asp-tRNA(Asn)/Glu-tRNA(Gln) amidotransferase subunit GatB [SAR202 cluster bacterium]|nr:Asp-tRNA(Asn)/Glu-tRNA(Gln) amidotransferase subunit GatB [SAR202 cluster bacterium]
MMVTATDYELVIGLEVHSQLLTKSKMFCSCASDYQDAPPNTRVCPVCMGMPGVLPVINEKAVELVIATGLALNCSISRYTKFDRKNYPYPDLMKGYQISQYDLPIALGGNLTVEAGGQDKRIGVTRVHLEEDVAKLMHQGGADGEGYSLMDINRSGVPLMEIVSEPDMRTAEEAKAYLTTLHTILRYIGVSTGNMEEGSFRCDANISIRPKGSPKFGNKVEVKNMNSFRSVFNALGYEAERQMKLAWAGERIAQETRGWVDDKGITVSQRSKEAAHDYRYFPEPDLPPLFIEAAWVDRVKATLPELPQAKQERFESQYGLSAYDARLLTVSRPTADYFETVLKVRPLTGEAYRQTAKAVSNWMLGELTRLLNATGQDIGSIKIGPEHVIDLLDMIEAGTLNTSMAKTVFEEMFNSGKSPKQIAEASGMVQITDAGAVSKAADEAIAANAKAVEDYRKGKDTAIRFLVGQVMKVTKGKANPQVVTTVLKDKLDALK